MKSGDTIDLAYRSIRKHYELKGSFDLYQGIVSLYALARLVVDARADQYLDELKRELMPYVRDERRFKSNFPNYFCGGVATPYLLWKGLLPEAEGIVRHYADEVMNDAPRDPAGILCHPRHPGESRIWVDVAFAVGPFMLFAGLALNDERYLSESYAQTAKMYKVLRDPENGLMHQSRGFRGADFISEDHWSRGNGWMAFALTELLHYLPENHPDREAAVALYLEHTLACAQYQGDDGMWRQEMTEVHLSYVETSGTALLLIMLRGWASRWVSWTVRIASILKGEYVAFCGTYLTIWMFITPATVVCAQEKAPSWTTWPIALS